MAHFHAPGGRSGPAEDDLNNQFRIMMTTLDWPWTRALSAAGTFWAIETISNVVGAATCGVGIVNAFNRSKGGLKALARIVGGGDARRADAARDSAAASEFSSTKK
jgi:hypothetical protein